MERRLAAILAADVVGYSRMVEADEVGTLAALAIRRTSIFEPLLAQHRGRIFKLIGDGVLIEFASAVNAVQYAVELQRRMAEANAKLPDHQTIVLRVGVNLGDVVVDGLDIQGDGVNLAARLEALAEPGGICLSAKVYHEVCRKVDVGFEDLGEQSLKNLVTPVRIYRVRIGEQRLEHQTGRQLPRSKPSIAVLPFDNLSGDPEQRYFSDGIAEDITTELSRSRSLFVIARNSSFQYRDKATDVRRIARELGVQYVVEGSVRKGGDRLRISAQLIDATTGNHLWAERYDRSLEDLFLVQDEVVRTVAGTLIGRLEAAGTEQAKRKPPTSLTAYDYVLRGKAMPLGDLQGDAEKRQMYEMAVKLDPDYGLAHSLLALSVFLEWFRDMTESDIALGHAFELAKKAVALDEGDSTCQSVMGWMYLFRKSFDLADQYYRRALELNPNDPETLARMSFLYAFLGRPDDAFGWLKQARVLDPYFNSTWYWHNLGLSHFIAHRYEEAIAAFSRSSTMPFWVRAYLAACYRLTNVIDRARELAAEILRMAPDFSSARLAAKEPFRHAADREHLLEGMRKAGLP
jgi:adenylate cyclase